MAQKVDVLVRQVYLVYLFAQVGFELCLVFIGVLVGKFRLSIQCIQCKVVAWIDAIILVNVFVNQFGNDGKDFGLWKIA